MIRSVQGQGPRGWEVHAQVTISVGRDEEGFIAAKVDADDTHEVFDRAELDCMANLALAAYERWRAEDQRWWERDRRPA